ncbi:hypothetical protein CCMSSC00406_0002361 [Pleurotus cornucopiae]|uniref:Uncharacterized protein n=1 Tax=Pleurotus cornucopiae TaxID=5321 RepID=A0ACB7IS67_PLECO|nr:hypothetical protein CCMSSC00406_0002361 [Pleurotus cornucopiae]
MREASLQAKLAQQESLRKVRDAEHQTRIAEIIREEAARTTQHFILGSLVTFGSGLDVRHLITGFECCTMQIKNLPVDARDAEIANIFLDQGIEPGRFKILENKVTPDGRRAVKVITDAESGEVLAIGLEDIEFMDEKLEFEVGPYNLPGGMGASVSRDINTLTVSWKAPSIRFAAEFDDMETTRNQGQALNGKVLMERRVKVEVNIPPTGRRITLFNPNSILISNVNPGADEASVRTFTGALNVGQLPPFITPYSDSDTLDSLRRHVGRLSAGLTSFEEASSTRNRLNGVVTVKVRFESRFKAERAHKLLSNGTLPGNMGMKESTFWLHLPEPLQYTSSIPLAQYSAQKSQWDSLAESIKDAGACNFVVDKRAADVVRIRLLGKAKTAMGAFKVRIESLVAGEKIEGWHLSFGYPNNDFIQSIPRQTGGFLRADYRLKVLKAYGKPDVVNSIRVMVQSELQKPASREWSCTVRRQSVGFFIRRGVPMLQAMFGNEIVRFNAVSRVITVRGEDARRSLKIFIAQSIEEVKIPITASTLTKQICPVCYDNVTNPFVLACKHVYRTPCMRHLSSAEETDAFHLMCIGEEGRCGVPVPIPVVQRFLTPADFTRLLEVVFASYVEKNPRSLRYCKTSDCNQIYRTTDRVGTDCTVQCPSCFSIVCSACHEDGHGGMSCEDAKLQRAEDHEQLSEAWIQQRKRGPRCQAPIESSGGCNDMSCRCGAHICWTCMGAFSRETTYEHMDDVHDGIHDEEIIPGRVNYDEQRRVLRQTREARERAADGRRVPEVPRTIQLEERMRQEVEARARQVRRRETEILQARRAREVELEAREREAQARRVRELKEAETRRAEHRREFERILGLGQEREREKEKTGWWYGVPVLNWVMNFL